MIREFEKYTKGYDLFRRFIEIDLENVTSLYIEIWPIQINF